MIGARRQGRRRYAAVAVLALLAALVGVAGPWTYTTFVDDSAKDRIEAQPPPPLFPDHVVAPIGREVKAQEATARLLMSQWWATHDAAPHDAQFVTWVKGALPPPPTGPRRAAELQVVQALARHRTTSGTKAAMWLEMFGKKDLWKLAMHDQAELLRQPVGDRDKNQLDDALKMAKDIADALGSKYRQSAPYVIEPSLRPDHTVTRGQTCPCSYPSRHAAAGAAARTFLGVLAPHRMPDYRWTEEEIDYSRVYMAGHVPSDITAGALLGDLIGDYFVVTRHSGS